MAKKDERPLTPATPTSPLAEPDPVDQDQSLVHIGKVIREARLARGMRQSDFARLVGCSTGQALLMEHGKAGLSVRTLVVVADVIGIDVADFFPRRLSDPGRLSTEDRIALEAVSGTLDRLKEETARASDRIAHLLRR